MSVCLGPWGFLGQETFNANIGKVPVEGNELVTPTTMSIFKENLMLVMHGIFGFVILESCWY